MRVGGSESGQALTELVGVAGALAAVFVGSAFLFQAEWNRARCARVAFEIAHRARIGNPIARLRARETDSGFRAVARCGRAVETIELPSLETMIRGGRALLANPF